MLAVWSNRDAPSPGRVLRNGESLEINGEKTVARLEVAENIRNTWAETLRLLFTTPVCHRDLLNTQREA